MNHIALFGDSIFDNEVYVPQGKSVIEALRRELGPSSWATLRAVDGSVTQGVSQQWAYPLPDWTHLVISSGGNDALACQSLLEGGTNPLWMADEGLSGGESPWERLTLVRLWFRKQYRNLIDSAAELDRPMILCTIYDSVPGLAEELKTALSVFNDVILAEAIGRGFPVIDLRSLCDEPEDYSEVLNIEPSARASQKIARAIVAVVAHHDFATRVSAVYGKGVLGWR